MDCVIFLSVLFVVIQAEIQNISTGTSIEVNNGVTDVARNKEVVTTGTGASKSTNSYKTLDKDKHQSSTTSHTASQPTSVSNSFKNTTITRLEGIVPERIATIKSHSGYWLRKASNREMGKASAGKMLAPLFKVGYKISSGVVKGANGVKEVASGTYKVADSAFDLVKMGLRRIGSVLL